MSPVPSDIYEETQRERLLSLIAICGEFPADQISRLPGGERYKQNMIQQLKNRKQIKTFYKDGLRGYRLLLPTKESLLEQNPERFTFYMTGVNETNHIRSEITRRLRLHRLAETFVTMMNGGVKIYRDDKPDIFAVDYILTEIKSPMFYNSREIKELGDEAIKINGSRAMGILFTPTDLFSVYNIGDSLIEWDYKIEMRFKAIIQTTICQKSFSQQYTAGSIHGLMFVKSMRLAAEILNQPRQKEYFIFDGNYNHFYCLTNDHRGERILQMLCSAELNEKMHELLSENLYEHDPGHSVENDAIDDDGNPVLFACTFDLVRLRRFVQGIMMQNKTGTIYCFDFQKEALTHIIDERIQIRTVSFEKWERRLFLEEYY